MLQKNLEQSKIIKKKGIIIQEITQQENSNTDLPANRIDNEQENNWEEVFLSKQTPSQQFIQSNSYMQQDLQLIPPQITQNLENPQEQNIQNNLSLDINKRYYKGQCVEIVQPILHQNGIVNKNTIQNNQDKITQVSDNLEDSTDISNEQNNPNVSYTQNNMEVSELEYQLDDAVSSEFKEWVDDFLKKQQENDFGSQFGQQNRFIKIIEVQNFNQISEALLKQFSNFRYSQICYVIPYLITKEKCIEFLSSIPQHNKRKIFRIISEQELQPKINQTTETSQIQKSKIKTLDKGKNVQKLTTNEQQNQKQIKAKVPFEQGLNQINSNLIQLSKEEQQKKFLQNRERLIQEYVKKAELIKEFTYAKINEQTFNTRMKSVKEKIEKLISEGKQLFLQQITFQQNFCTVDFHKFFAAEIENLLDGIFDKIDEYKQKNQIREITLKIIVGKGNHSINGKPVIGPMTQQYIRQEFQKEVQIDQGVIKFKY